MEQIKPLVSIVVPIYNSEKYLDKCITSLLNQTLHNIEIILVNDASPDNSIEIMKKYAAKDNRIVIIDSKVNGGPTVKGIKKSSADYIGFVDADDWIEPTMYEDMYNATNNEAIDVVVGGYYWYYDDNHKVYDTNIRNEAFSSLRNVKNEVGIHGGRMMMNLWKKSLITDNEFFFLPHNSYSDSVVFLWYMKAKAFTKLDKPYYYYRQNPISVTARKDCFSFFDRLASADDMLQRGKLYGLYDDNKDAFEAAYYRLYLRNTLIGSVRNFTVLPIDKVKECIEHYYKQHSIKDVKLLKGNRSIFDWAVAVMVRSPKIGSFLMEILLKASKLKNKKN